MRVYADSSFLVSCDLVDANTPRAQVFLSEHHAPLPFTALHELEVRNALRLGVFRRVITDDQAKAATAAIDADLGDGRLVRLTVKWPDAFPATLKLSETARREDRNAESGHPSHRVRVSIPGRRYFAQRKSPEQRLPT